MKRMVLVLCALCVVNTTAQAEIHPVWGAEIVSVDPDPMFGYELAVDSEYGAPSAMFPEGMDVDVRGESPCAPVDALTGEELHTALLAGLYWNMFKPVWSPDGNWIATNSAQGGIFVIPAGGGEPVLVYDDIYEPYGDYLFVMHSVGGRGVLGFTPDSREVLFTRQYITENTVIDITYTEDGSIGHISSTGYEDKVMAVDIETGETRLIADDCSFAAYSPDGRYLVIARSGDGSVIRDLETGIERTPERKVNPRSVFTPDGSAFLYMSRSTLYRYPLDDSGPEEAIANLGGYASGISISSDGEWLLFHRGVGQTTIEQYDEHGTPSGTLSTDIDKLRLYNFSTDMVYDVFPPESYIESYDGCISPDGSQICYVLNDLRTWYPEWDLYVQDFPSLSDLAKLTGVADDTPAQFTIAGNYPNPFNPATTISFSLAEPGHAGLAVYNIAGQLVRELVGGILTAGTHDIVWDGCDDTGVRVSSGVYIARLTSGTNSQAHRMTLIK